MQFAVLLQIEEKKKLERRYGLQGRIINKGILSDNETKEARQKESRLRVDGRESRVESHVRHQLSHVHVSMLSLVGC